MGRDTLPVQHTGDQRQVLVTAIGATAYDDLVHRSAGHLPHRDHVAGTARQGDQWLNGGEVEPHVLVVGGVGIRTQGTKIGFTALSGQVTPHLLVGRKD